MDWQSTWQLRHVYEGQRSFHFCHHLHKAIIACKSNDMTPIGGRNEDDCKRIEVSGFVVAKCFNPHYLYVSLYIVIFFCFVKSTFFCLFLVAPHYFYLLFI